MRQLRSGVDGASVDDSVCESARRSLVRLTVVYGAHGCPCQSTGPLLLPGPDRAPFVAPMATVEE
jgi:hypothetical protein